METPVYSHLTARDFDHVYEPAEDTFLLLDALELELPELLEKKPQICLEIGPGSGIVISAIAKYLNYQPHGFFASDINKYACDATSRTASANKVNVEVFNMDLLTSFKQNSIDLLVFNPPYVPTPSEDTARSVPEQQKFYDDEAAGVFNRTDDEKLLIKSWAGGSDGCDIINRVIADLPRILAPGGIFYLLIIKENNPEKIKSDLEGLGFDARQIIDRKIRGEHLIVLKVTQKNSSL